MTLRRRVRWRRVTALLPIETIRDMQKEAERTGRSLTDLVRVAWQMAQVEIASIPPEETRRPEPLRQLNVRVPEPIDLELAREARRTGLTRSRLVQVAWKAWRSSARG